MPSSDMDLDRPKSREESSVLTENTDDFIIGDRVWVNGTKPGYIQYLGETRFSPGDWAGVVLDDHSGKNDGSVAGVHYFQCEPRRGVFARLHKLTRYPLLHGVPSTPSPPPAPARSVTPTRTPSPGARSLREGDRVTVTSAAGQVKMGVLRYLGQTDFAAGEWAGVELDEPLGKNDGTVAGKRYFRCLPNFGLFSPAHKVARISGSIDRHRRHTDSDKDTSSFRGSTPSLQDDHRRYTEESEKRAQRLRQLLEAAEAERRTLASKLEDERKKVEELEFRIEEECIGKDDLESEREGERRKIEELERRLEQEIRKNEMIAGGATPDSVLKDEVKSLNDETKSLREKLKQSEAKVQNLETAAKQIKPHTSSLRADELVRKEEALLQSQLSLDNKKREIQNLLNRISELEKDLEKSKSRQKKQLETIDELNIKLQKSESKSVNLAEELHSSKEKCEETERRLRSSKDQVSQLEAEKKRLEQQLLSPESTPQEQALLSRLQDREKELLEWRREAEKVGGEVDRLREEKERARREAEERVRVLAEEHREESRKERKRAAESEESSGRRIRELERLLQSMRQELESSRLESEARLTRQEARLQEADLRADSLERLRESVSRLQAEKDLLRVEKEETLKRLQISEQGRTRWELEANRASQEVNILKSSVQHLRTEFANHREDLVKKLAQTEFDAEAVQSLHVQIEEQRRVVEMMQKQLRHAEVEREHLQTELSSQKEDKVQVENGLRQDLESLKRRLTEAEAEKQSVKRSLEAAQLLIEERTASQRQLQIQNAETLETEKTNLENKIKDLQRELSTVRNGKNEPDLCYEDIKNEKEALEQQVNFMNSVIVDMQHKNDDLRSRLEILETEVIFDGNLHLSIPQHRSMTRLFCDICRVFNIHDTEDCPKQLNSVRRTQSYSSQASQESEF